MKTFTVYEPGRYQLADIPIPEITDDEVLVHVGAAGICHSDLDIITGRRKHLVSYPVVLGHEFAGTIERVGKSVIGFAPGDTVTAECMIWCGSCRFCSFGRRAQCDNYTELGTMRNGGFAEYVAVPKQLVHKFKNLPMEMAAITECIGNSHKAVDIASIVPGERIAVIGPGPIGLYAVQMARLKFPSQIICVGTRDSRLAVARQMGADTTININKQDAASEIMRLTGGLGVDVVLQCATTDSAMELAVEIAGKGSRIIIEGLSSMGKGVNLNFDKFVTKPMSIIGATGADSNNFEAVLRLMESKAFETRDTITHILPLNEIEKGFKMLTDKTCDAIKVVVKP